MACADCVYFGNSELEGTSWQSLDPIGNPVTFEKILRTHGGAFASFVLLRRETVLKIGLFDEALRLLEDYHYWLKFLYRGGRMAYLHKVLGKRRMHATPDSGQSSADYSAPKLLDLTPARNSLIKRNWSSPSWGWIT